MKQVFRLLLLALFLFFLHSQGAPLYLLAVLAVFFGVMLVLREKIWGNLDAKVNEISLTRSWPSWTRWLLVLLVFVAVVYVLKTIVYYFLGIVGLDVQAELVKTFNASN